MIIENLETAMKEIDILIKYAHPNIIKYFYYEIKSNYIHLVLEKCICSLD